LYCPHGHARERNPDSLRDYPVAHCVADGRVAYDIEPLGDGDLRGDDGGVASMAVLDDLEEGETVLSVERHEAEIIEDQEGRARDAADVPLVAAGGALLLEHLEELRAVEVEGSVAEGAGLGSKGLREVAFADTGRPRDDDALSRGDPSAVGKAHEGIAVEASVDREVDFGKGRA